MPIFVLNTIGIWKLFQVAFEFQGVVGRHKSRFEDSSVSLIG